MYEYAHRHAPSTNLLPATAISTDDMKGHIYMYNISGVCMYIHKCVVIL